MRNIMFFSSNFHLSDKEDDGVGKRDTFIMLYILGQSFTL